MMDQEIARALKVGTATVERVRRRCVEEGVAAPWVARSNSTAAGKIWTVRVKRIWWPWLAPSPRRDGSVGPCECWLLEREIVESISTETVRRTLKKRTEALR